VYFDDKDSSLKDLVILEPQFLTELLSSIITTKHVFVRDGILNHKVRNEKRVVRSALHNIFFQDLVHIWREPKFPRELHASFLSLLEKFEITWQITSSTLSPSGRARHSIQVCDRIFKEK
jgi:hypothetical protein